MNIAGSFGTVIRAKCRSSQKLRAIKAIRRINKVDMLTIELELLSELGGHFNIVKLYDFFHFNGSVAIVLEYFPHCAATELLYHSRSDDKFALLYIRNLLTAVSYLHQNGYVHRDIKLSNFLYSHKAKAFRLVDFGLATIDRSKNEMSRNAAASAMSREGPCTVCDGFGTPCMFCGKKPKRENVHIVGTPGVRAPEILFGIGLCNPAIDIFSCGIVLLSLVSLKHPFFMPKDETENIYHLAFLLGSESIENMGRLEGLRVTLSEKLPPADYYHLVMSLRHGFQYMRTNFTPKKCQLCHKRSFNNPTGVCFCRENYQTNMFYTGENDKDIMTLYVDLLYRALEPDRFKRYTADQLLCVIESFDRRQNYVPKPLSNRDDD
ncbi:hypothetical protein B9Z55_001175 [Caenorhabditis nigoni]|uniref:non-specific serine/threonine protein kinase n=1 Tax=Caenorhabditis nigoni TaxID=1611254 RepID=A0A2G5VEG8_9PELO|nr:hypothetical protein B9Z55_001175 [Caenorhabditis nigoni]